VNKKNDQELKDKTKMRGTKNNDDEEGKGGKYANKAQDRQGNKDE
jgi:hypothetical protein